MEAQEMTEPKAGQMAFPLQLGGEQISRESFEAWPRDEQEFVARLSALGLGERFWESYRSLRGKGYRWLDAIVGGWLATGAKGRGQLRTLKSLAEALGRHRHTIYTAVERVQAAANALALSWLAERVPDVDEATYHAAISMEGTAADRKLFYQRARVALSGEESEPVDAWAQVLAAVEEQTLTPNPSPGVSGEGREGAE